MGPGEMYETAGYVLLAAGAVLSLYVTPFMPFYISAIFSKRIKSQKELDACIERESSRLGISGVNGRYSKRLAGSVYIKKGEKFIDVGGFVARPPVVRHELFHHYREDPAKKNANGCRRILHAVREQLISETSASIYDAFKIKL